MRVSPKRLVIQNPIHSSTSALGYASALGKPFDPAPQQDYVPCQGSASFFQDHPSVPNDLGPDLHPSYFCLVRGCETTCNRVSDLHRHYEAQHQSPPFRGSASSFQAQSIVPNNPGPDRTGRFFCSEPGCSTSCSRKGDLERHCNTKHRIPGIKREFRCQFEGCIRSETPFDRKDKLQEHLRNIHNIGA